MKITLIKNQNDLLDNSEKILLNLFNANDKVEEPKIEKKEQKEELINSIENEIINKFNIVDQDVKEFTETNKQEIGEKFIYAFQQETVTNHFEEIKKGDPTVNLYQKIKNIEDNAGRSYAIKYLKAYLEYTNGSFEKAFLYKNAI